MDVAMIESPAALERLCERVATAARVGIDTEFHNERTYTARLMIVQLAFDEGYAIIDALKLPDLRPVIEAMSGTLVIGHALSSDLKIFADRFDAVPPRIFDCQVGAAFLGYGMAISLADLVGDLCGVRLKKSQTVSDWSARPLSERQLEYLVDDVAHLLDMQTMLTERLRASGRYEWAMEECRELTDLSRYRVDERRMYGKIPGANRMSRRELGILAEIVKLRDGLARERDLPPKYVLADDVVAGLATLRPRGPEDLAQLRRLDAGTRRALGPAIIDAVRRGEAIPEAQLPAKFSKPLGNARETLVSLMSVVVGEIAREHALPPSMLATRTALERLAREAPGDRGEFERVLGLSPWRTQLVAEPLWRLLSGEAALRIEGHATGDPRIIVES